MSRWLPIAQALLEDIAKEKSTELRTIAIHLMKILEGEEEESPLPVYALEKKKRAANSPNIVAGTKFNTSQEAADYLGLQIDRYKYFKRYAIKARIDDIYDYIKTRKDGDEILGKFIPMADQDALDELSQAPRNHILRRPAN